jgi:hypothetical protein
VLLKRAGDFLLMGPGTWEALQVPVFDEFSDVENFSLRVYYTRKFQTASNPCLVAFMNGGKARTNTEINVTLMSAMRYY